MLWLLWLLGSTIHTSIHTTTTDVATTNPIHSGHVVIEEQTGGQFDVARGQFEHLRRLVEVHGLLLLLLLLLLIGSECCCCCAGGCVSGIAETTTSCTTTAKSVSIIVACSTGGTGRRRRGEHPGGGLHQPADQFGHLLSPSPACCCTSCACCMICVIGIWVRTASSAIGRGHARHLGFFVGLS